jgi:hypothetical protein
MTTASANVGKLEEQLSHWGAKLDELVAKAEEVDAELKSDYRKRIEALRAKHRAAHAKLEEFKAAGSGKWDHFKTGIECAWNELEDAFRELKHPQKR